MTADPKTEDALARPLRLSRICVKKVWGGHALADVLGIELEGGEDAHVGETWELSDRDEHSSTVADGRFEGQSLRWLMQNEREALMGDTEIGDDDPFPLLVKFISASQPLSVQVHPDEKIARKIGNGEAGKCEAWYVLAAEPDSLLYLGLRPEVGPAEFAAAAGGLEVVDLLQTWAVKPGQFVYVPAGTLHAIGGGITLLEVQQNSDTTYRVFDWGRTGMDGKPRKIHLEEALLATRYDVDVGEPVMPELEKVEGGSRGALLIDCDHFRMEVLEVCGHVHRTGIGRPVVLVCVAGAGSIAVAGGEPEEFVVGDTWLIPASTGDWRVDSKGGECRLVLAETKAPKPELVDPEEDGDLESLELETESPQSAEPEEDQ